MLPGRPHPSTVVRGRVLIAKIFKMTVAAATETFKIFPAEYHFPVTAKPLV